MVLPPTVVDISRCRPSRRAADGEPPNGVHKLTTQGSSTAIFGAPHHIDSRLKLIERARKNYCCGLPEARCQGWYGAVHNASGGPPTLLGLVKSGAPSQGRCPLPADVAPRADNGRPSIATPDTRCPATPEAHRTPGTSTYKARRLPTATVLRCQPIRDSAHIGGDG